MRISKRLRFLSNNEDLSVMDDRIHAQRRAYLTLRVDDFDKWDDQTVSMRTLKIGTGLVKV